MTAQPVEWVLVVFYGRSAHQATYGRRVIGGGYTKDYIQLSRKRDFLAAVSSIFSVAEGETSTVPLTYKWPKGASTGEFVFKSADRPHLKWETSQGAPNAWKMTLVPSDSTAETIPGDPTKTDLEEAEKEFELIAERGAGQPYLLAVKLREESRTLHLRAYLSTPSEEFEWASLALAPKEIQNLAARTSSGSALSWSVFQSGGVAYTKLVSEALANLASSTELSSTIDRLDEVAGQQLLRYLKNPGHGLFFDPSSNHDAWLSAPALSPPILESLESIIELLNSRFPEDTQSDFAAEGLEVDPSEVEAFREQIGKKNYEVADTTSSVKTRGSAQRAFSEIVKKNYSFQCAITGLKSRAFLVASHIVPWSKDKTIRLDPANGICLSLIVDKAFEKGYLLINDDFSIQVDWVKVGSDATLRELLLPYEGMSLTAPSEDPPCADYLRRRRDLFSEDAPTE